MYFHRQRYLPHCSSRLTPFHRIRTYLNTSVTFRTLFLLPRLKNCLPIARGSSNHPLFISAIMIASDIICNNTYSNSHAVSSTKDPISLKVVEGELPCRMRCKLWTPSPFIADAAHLRYDTAYRPYSLSPSLIACVIDTINDPSTPRSIGGINRTDVLSYHQA
jgi:hypothetical protein